MRFTAILARSGSCFASLEVLLALSLLLQGTCDKKSSAESLDPVVVAQADIGTNLPVIVAPDGWPMSLVDARPFLVTEDIGPRLELERRDKPKPTPVVKQKKRIEAQHKRLDEMVQDTLEVKKILKAKRNGSKKSYRKWLRSRRRLLHQMESRPGWKRGPPDLEGRFFHKKGPELEAELRKKGEELRKKGPPDLKDRLRKKGLR